MIVNALLLIISIITVAAIWKSELIATAFSIGAFVGFTCLLLELFRKRWRRK